MLEKTKKLATATTAPVELTPFEFTTAPPARLLIAVEGITELLTHNPESMGVVTGAKKGSKIPEPEVEAESGCYRMEDGSFAIKGESFRGSLLKAAGAYKLKGKTTAKSVLAHVTVVEMLVQLTRPDGKLIKDYTIDSRRAIVQRQGIIRRRPKFWPWATRFSLEYDPELLQGSPMMADAQTPKVILDVLADAGSRMGVGDYRPACGGWFGRFRIVGYRHL